MQEKNQALYSNQEEKTPNTNNLIITADESIEAGNLIDDIASVYPPVGTVEDVARILKMPVTSVRGLCRAGQLSGFKVGKLWRIPRVELISFIEEGGC